MSSRSRSSERAPRPDPVRDPSLHAALLDAHAAADEERLARLYVRAADEEERAGDVDATCFFLTQAWVFALRADLPETGSIRDRLARHGRV